MVVLGMVALGMVVLELVVLGMVQVPSKKTEVPIFRYSIFRLQ
jgi:hypothetical protein